jgi:hypothetical protein
MHYAEKAGLSVIPVVKIVSLILKEVKIKSEK